MTQSKSNNVQETINEVRRRSTVDPDFRALALRDASAAVKKVSQTPLPPGVTFKFVDNSGPELTVPLPDTVPSDQLSEMELENVSGGTFSVSGQWSKASLS